MYRAVEEKEQEKEKLTVREGARVTGYHCCFCDVLATVVTL